MTLKENSKSFVYLITVYTFVFFTSIYEIIVNILGFMGSVRNTPDLFLICVYLKNVVSIIPIFVLYLLLLKIYLKERNNVDKVLSAFSVSIILSLICSVIVSVVSIFVFKETTTILRVIFFLFGCILSILTLVAINAIKEQGKTIFYKVMLIVKLICFFISRLVYWEGGVYTSALLFQAVNFVIGLLSTLAVYMYIKDIICNEKTQNTQDLQEENIAKNVILTIITFGVYGYIWLYRISRNIKCLNNDKSSLTSELLCLLFVPFYMLYWVYTRAKAIKTQADYRNIQISDSATGNVKICAVEKSPKSEIYAILNLFF